MKQVAVMTYKIKKVDHHKVVKAGRAYLDYEFANPHTFLYTNTRYYFRENPENPEEEIWMFIDYFDYYEDYEKSLQQSDCKRTPLKSNEFESTQFFIRKTILD